MKIFQVTKEEVNIGYLGSLDVLKQLDTYAFLWQSHFKLSKIYYQEHGVIWLGFIADENRRIEILRKTDVFILPSLVEGLSLSLLEAMACGVACVATDVGADGEVLEKGAGIVLDTKATRSQLRTLLPLFQDHPEITTLLGKKARERVLERYNLTNNITQLEILYEEVLGQKQVQLTP